VGQEAPAQRSRGLGRGRRGLPSGLVGLVFVLGMVAIAVLAPFVAPQDPVRQQIQYRLKPPGFDTPAGLTYMLGTDQLGRDILSRASFGARASLRLRFIVVTFARSSA
jgi:peptide/nickel transport system permease protein